MWCIMTIVSCIVIVHYIMLMSFVLVYVTDCACVVFSRASCLVCAESLVDNKNYLNRPNHDYSHCIQLPFPVYTTNVCDVYVSCTWLCKYCGYICIRFVWLQCRYNYVLTQLLQMCTVHPCHNVVYKYVHYCT